MLGGGINDSAGVKLLADTAFEYDKVISRVRRDRDLNTAKMVLGQTSFEKGFTLARENIIATALENTTHVGLNYSQATANIERVFEGHRAEIHSAKKGTV